MTQPVRPGQVWQSRDRRETRYVRVESTDGHFAIVVRCGIDGQVHGVTRRSRVRVAPNGTLSRYRLVSEPA